MASSLLKCSICPKKPSFSDTSHLLTHVGSKGHLSHLHKLQVRSHQEISAGHELAAYDLWYHKHDLGTLLSERMVQKESKKCNKRGRLTTQRHFKKDPDQKDIKTRIPVPSGRHPVVKGRQLHQTRSARKLNVYNLAADQANDSDYEESPSNQKSRRKARRVYKSPLQHSWSPEHERDSEDDCPAITDPATPKVDDESPKLKGIYWPGMDLFDAATEEMRRRRNQRKDGSALKNMEMTSERVMPAEAIYSPGGTWQKTRVITGNADETSPLRGETPVPKPIRRRRQPLAETDANVFRTANRRGKGRKGRTRTRLPQNEVAKEESLGIPSSPLNGAYHPASRFSPTEDENLEFKLTIDNLKDQRKRGNFAIFNDAGYARLEPQPQSALSNFDVKQSCSHLAQSYAPQAPPRPPIEFMTTPWLQPQYQQSASYHDMYTSIGQSGISSTYDGLGMEKENVDPGLTAVDRPSVYPQHAQYAPSTVTAQDHFRSVHASRLGHFGLGGLNMFDDPFGYSTNPLSAAFHQMPNALESPFDATEDPFTKGDTATAAVLKGETGAVSPDGTLSDDNELDDGQNIFTTS